MAVKGNPRMNRDDHGYAESFNVTVERVIGNVRLDGRGEYHPHEAAMRIIALEGEMAEGVYRFPLESGQTAVVDITWQTPLDQMKGDEQ